MCIYFKNRQKCPVHACKSKRLPSWLCPGLWRIPGGSHVLVLPQHDQAEALQETLHPQTVSQEQQQHAGTGQAVDVDHGALLRQEALGQSVTVRRHRQLRHRETRRISESVSSLQITTTIWPQSTLQSMNPGILMGA